MDFCNTIDISDLILAISSSGGFIDPLRQKHQARVTLISHLIAKEISYSNEFLRNIILAGLLHDIGFYFDFKKSKSEFESLIENKENEKGSYIHPEISYKILKGYPYFSEIARIVRYHHTSYKKTVENPEFMHVPFSSHILHLADAIDFFITRRLISSGNSYLLSFTTSLVEYLEKLKGIDFHPKLVDIFAQRLAHKEAFWFEIYFSYIDENILKLLRNYGYRIPKEEIKNLSRLIAYLIDFKSKFTAIHSSGVTQTARSIAKFFRFTEPDLEKIEIAGLLHDIGKIAISNVILEKSGKLTEEEFNVVKSHVFHTYKILSKLNVDLNIIEWASFHHERLDGTGYPFHLDASKLSIGARIMAVADIFTALMEDRPYKKGLSAKKSIAILDDLVKKGKIDKTIVNVLKMKLKFVDYNRKMAQENEEKVYNSIKKLIIVI